MPARSLKHSWWCCAMRKLWPRWRNVWSNAAYTRGTRAASLPVVEERVVQTDERAGALVGRARRSRRARAGSRRRSCGGAARCRASRSAPGGRTDRVRRGAGMPRCHASDTNSKTSPASPDDAHRRPAVVGQRLVPDLVKRCQRRPERWLPGTIAVGPSASVQSAGGCARRPRRRGTGSGRPRGRPRVGGRAGRRRSATVRP